MKFDGIARAIFVGLLVIIAFAIGGSLQESIVRKDAIKAGVAEWYLDELSNKAFRYKTNCPCEKFEAK